MSAFHGKPTHVSAPDGRTLEVLLSGAKDGFPLVFHHGTPQAAVRFPFLERTAVFNDLRLISYSRPGYGRSTPRADGDSAATVADDAGDVETILDYLGLNEFLSVGWSGGGPRSLACAALLPERCRAAACGVGIAPFDAEGLDPIAGMAPENVAEYAAVAAGKEALEEYLTEHGSGVFNATADDIVVALGELLAGVDKEALTGDLAEYLAASTRHAGLQGIVGWRDDDLTHTRPWGFNLGTIKVPVSIWQGTEDRMVPLAHAHWLAANVAGARAHIEDGEGHLSLLKQMDRILDDLLDLADLRW
jgi:pimeloyl-ACP methyl ester carboxylesterase